MYGKKMTISVRKFKMPVYTLIALALFNVQYISRIPVLDFGVNVVRLFLFATFLFKARKKLKTNPAFLCLLGIFLIEIFSTLIFNGNVVAVVIRYLNILAAALWISFSKDEYNLIIPSIYIAASFLVIINTIAMIQFPHGIYIGEDFTRRWIIGQKQEFCYVFIIAVVLGMIFWKENKYRILTVINFCMIIYSIHVTLPLGLIIYFIVFIGTLICLSILKKEIKAVTLVNINMIGAVLFIMFIYTATKFTSLFSLLSGIRATYSITKADTFLARIGIWRDAINVFLSSPIFGRGLISVDSWNMIGRYSLYHPHFHNIYLDMLASGGVICLGLYIAMLYLVAIKMDNYRSSFRRIFLASIFALNIFQLSECAYSCFVFGLFFLGYYISELNFEKKRKVLSLRRN